MFLIDLFGVVGVLQVVCLGEYQSLTLNLVMRRFDIEPTIMAKICIKLCTYPDTELVTHFLMFVSIVSTFRRIIQPHRMLP